MMGPYVPPGHAPPFQVVDDAHHGAWVIIVVALGLVLSLVSFSIRLYVRIALHPPFGKDDYILLGATIVAIIQAVLLFEACAKGFGTSMELLEKEDAKIVQILVNISDILYLLTLYTTKCCVVGIYLRLSPQKLHKRSSWGTLVLCTLWVVPAILILTIDCGFNHPWNIAGRQCPNLLKRWQFIVALDIATELILFALAVILLAGLFMPLKRKFTIAFAFIFRIPMIVFAILHIIYLHRAIGSPDPTLDAVPALIWAQVELNYALVACSVFCLRPFMAAVSTNYGTAGDSTLESSRDASRQKSEGSKTGDGSGNRDGYTRDGTVIGNEALAVGILHGGHGGAGNRRTMQSPADDIELVNQARRTEGGSTKMVIRKDVQYTVEYG
ncbi:hypothetical protein BDV18DRAFT_38301 [Aspergillus unguis]